MAPAAPEDSSRGRVFFLRPSRDYSMDGGTSMKMKKKRFLLIVRQNLLKPEAA